MVLFITKSSSDCEICHTKRKCILYENIRFRLTATAKYFLVSPLPTRCRWA